MNAETISLAGLAPGERNEILQPLGIRLEHCGVPRNLSVTCNPPIHLVRTEIRGNVFVGAYSFMRSGRLTAKLGNFCSIAPGAVLGDGEHPISFLSTHPFQYGKSGFGFWEEFKDFQNDVNIPSSVSKVAPIIGSDVWIGTNAVVLRGVKVGHGAVIAAGSVVTKDVPPYAIVGGVPAKLIRDRFHEILIDKLLESKWWEYDAKSLEGLPFDDPEAALNELYERKTQHGIQKKKHTTIVLEHSQVTIKKSD